MLKFHHPIHHAWGIFLHVHLSFLPTPYDLLSDENPKSIHENVTNNETQPPVTENNEKKSDTDTSFDAKHDTVLDKFKGLTKKNPSS